MTLYQACRLSKLWPEEKYSCTFNIKKHPGKKFIQTYPGLKLKNERFSSFLERELNSEEKIEGLSQIYMCGPSRMTASILDSLEAKQIEREKYTII